MERLCDSTNWEQFEATARIHPILGGIGQIDEFWTDHWPGLAGVSARLFSLASGQWCIYWADSQEGIFKPPVTGFFTGNRGEFHGTELIDGHLTQVRFIWSDVDSATPRWEQAFSRDGITWETNWVMSLSKSVGSVEDEAPVSLVGIGEAT